MEAYVIKREDGYYYMDCYNQENRFTTGLYRAMFWKYKSDLEDTFQLMKNLYPKDFKYCKIVKVSITEVESD